MQREMDKTARKKSSVINYIVTSQEYIKTKVDI